MHTDLNKWMLEWLTCKDPYDSQIFCTTLWKLWCARNNVVFNDQAFDPITVAVATLELVHEYNHANPRLNTQAIQVPQLWKPPADSWTKTNVDVGCFKDCHTRWGMVVSNHKGEVLFAESKRDNLSMDGPDL